jgi:predicted Zn-dependent protease
MGLQAAPEMADQFGGLDPNQSDQQRVQQVGQRIVQDSPAHTTPYEYAYHLLADQETVNAFALPGGQIFITRALYDQLQIDDELAGVLGHETGHVVARHSAEQIAKAELTQGLTGAAVIAACDPNSRNGCIAASQMAALVGQLIEMKYSRADET